MTENIYYQSPEDAAEYNIIRDDTYKILQTLADLALGKGVRNVQSDRLTKTEIRYFTRKIHEQSILLPDSLKNLFQRVLNFRFQKSSEWTQKELARRGLSDDTKNHMFFNKVLEKSFHLLYPGEKKR
ncbi:hypothetical protein SCUP234_12451 [Seiridium cupressi]